LKYGRNLGTSLYDPTYDLGHLKVVQTFYIGSVISNLSNWAGAECPVRSLNGGSVLQQGLCCPTLYAGGVPPNTTIQFRTGSRIRICRVLVNGTIYMQPNINVASTELAAYYDVQSVRGLLVLDHKNNRAPNIPTGDQIMTALPSGNYFSLLNSFLNVNTAISRFQVLDEFRMDLAPSAITPYITSTVIPELTGPIDININPLAPMTFSTDLSGSLPPSIAGPTVQVSGGQVGVISIDGVTAITTPTAWAISGRRQDFQLAYDWGDEGLIVNFATNANTGTSADIVDNNLAVYMLGFLNGIPCGVQFMSQCYYEDC
jgi:hypothetical protein